MKLRPLLSVLLPLLVVFTLSLVPALSWPSLGPLLGQDKAAKNPIDKQLDACMDKNGSTAGMVQCIETARKSWDKAMNVSYQKVMARLDATGKATLKSSQLAWLAYRDREYKTQNAIYSKMQGTMYIPMSVDSAMQLTKDRALLLDRYANLFEDAGM